MPIDIFMPQLSPTMTDGTIVRWLKKIGDTLRPGEVIAEIETDKATMELEVTKKGVLHRILVPEGSLVAVGDVIAVLAEKGEAVSLDYQPGHEDPAIYTKEEVVKQLQQTVASQPVEEKQQEDMKLQQTGIFNTDAEYDVVIIGAGPGGYVAAIRAAQLGLKTACVESTHLGGVCLNWGCIPTKALLRSAELLQIIRQHGDELGLGVQSMQPDIERAVARSRKIAEKLNKGIGFLFKKNNVTHIKGMARFTSQQCLMVQGDDGERQLTAKHIIVATGARARAFPSMDVDNDVIVTYKKALTPNKVPEKIVVIGSGAIGMEFAYFYRAMGSEVTVIEAAEQILPLEDIEISKVVARSFKKNHIKLINNAVVISAKNVDGRAVVEYECKGKSVRLEGDLCLVAVGVVANSDRIGVEHTNIAVEQQNIQVDEYYRTAQAGVYAIGDVIGAPALAHVASHEGLVCIEAIAGLNPDVIDYGNVPGCTYCQPQVGSCGKTEQQCNHEGIPIKVGRMSYAANGKAMGLAETEGLVKTIFHAETGKLLGAHIVGAEATELIVTLQLARTLGATEKTLIHHMFPHPTLSEIIHESVLSSQERSIHQ